MNAFRFPLQSDKFRLVVGIVLTVAAVHAEPFVPTNGLQVIERLANRRSQLSGQAPHRWADRSLADRTNVVLAAQTAKAYIERSRVEADPRLLGRAQAALAPWWTASDAPADLIVLRATIKQSQHEFNEALADLDIAVRSAPENAQAWLTQATVQTVLGRYTEARRSCLRLARLAPDLVATTVAANLAAVTGSAHSACESLRRVLDRSNGASSAERVWAWTVLGETEGRLGQYDQSEASFRRALALDSQDVYVLSALADLLLERQRPREAIELLKDRTDVDALLLRLALSEAQANPQSPTVTSYVNRLRERFEANALRGNRVHQREEARFRLTLLGEPEKALQLAQENWEVQREPADVRILLETALAANAQASAQPALEFAKTNHLEDVTVARLTAKLLEKARL